MHLPPPPPHHRHSQQGYTRLLHVLGSNLAEFLQNLDDLHLHLQYCWPDMVPPSFRCTEVCLVCMRAFAEGIKSGQHCTADCPERATLHPLTTLLHRASVHANQQVTSESLLLHYFSNRPGLWPIVVGVLKGLVKDYFKTELQVRGARRVLTFLQPALASPVTWSCVNNASHASSAASGGAGAQPGEGRRRPRGVLWGQLLCWAGCVRAASAAAAHPPTPT
jgi:hypothetical protein